MRPDTLDRMVLAVERVRLRLLRASAGLEQAGIPYAVVGGNAVAAWVAQVDVGAVRNTQDVDILLRRSDLPAAQAALGGAGFVYRHVKGLDLFLDAPDIKARDAIHVVFAQEKVRPEHLESAPDVVPTVRLGAVQTVGLEALVTMKLTAYRLKDRVHLQDLLEVGLIDAGWIGRMPASLEPRLRDLVENPDQ